MLDGNLTTGAFLLVDDRLDPSIAGLARGNPPLISPYLTLAAFGALGAWLFWRARCRTNRGLVAFLGLTWIIFLTWSPGWSPQWILYLIPLILLTLPFQAAFYGVSGLILLTLIEWPTLLAHAFFTGLWVIVPLRLAFFAWLGFRWYRLACNLCKQNITTYTAHSFCGIRTLPCRVRDVAFPVLSQQVSYGIHILPAMR